MSPRVGGILALTAAVLLAVSSFPVGKLVGERSISSWWSGHPTIGDNPEPFKRKEVHIGLLTSTGCDTGTEQTPCVPVPVGTGFKITKYVELGFVGVLGLALLLCGITALRASESRKLFAKIVLGAAAASAIVSIVLLAMGPHIETDRGLAVSVPLAITGGLGMFFLGTALSIVGGLMSTATAAATQPKVPGWEKPASAQSIASGAGTAATRASARAIPNPHEPQFDVLALLQEDALRPAALGPEPMMGRPVATAGALPGPSGPLAPVTSPQNQPLFSSAPQLRPLYEVPGSAGFVRPAQPPMPARGPTPMPQAVVSALTGAPTPPSPLPVAPPAPGQRTLPPPLRNKPASVAPPIPPPKPVAVPKPPGGPINRAQPTQVAAAVPIPREKAPPPSSSLFAKPVLTAGGTLAGVQATLPIAPDPDHDPEDLAGTASFEKDDEPSVDGTVNYRKADTEDAEPEFDAMATAAVEPDPTDPSLLAAGDSTSPSLELDASTATSNETFSTEIGTDADDDEETNDGIATAAVSRISRPHTAPATPQRIAAAAQSTPSRRSAPQVSAARPGSPSGTIPALPAPPSGQIPAVEAARRTGEVKVPISTAPQSLPPPKEKPSALAGPSPACPQCEAPMSWVEEHLRFYCKSCRMYF